MICPIVEGKEKLLAPKLNSLQKVIGHHKTKVSIPGVDVGSYYMNKNFVHAKNEQQYTIGWHPYVVDLL